MATIKSYTDISQSKKLAEILPLESADYHYIVQGKTSYFYPYSLSSDAVKDYDEEIKYIPCWSLASLMKLISKANDFDEKDLICSSTGYRYEMYYKKTKSNDIQMHNGKCCNNPLDAAFDMVCWLKENNKL